VIVVDTNVIAYLLIPGPWTEAAEDLLQAEPVWAAPHLWRSEFRNILAGYLRRGTLSFEQTLALQSTAESLLAGHETSVESRAVLELVRGSNCSAYDCEFVALARQSGSVLYTLDAKLLAAFPETAKPLKKGKR
jgi:predicted nucleic acid-binding protein